MADLPTLLLPQITSFTQFNTNPNNNPDDLGVGTPLAFDYLANEPLTVATGTVLNLSNGATATYEVGGAGMNFVYSPGVGDAATSDLKVIGYTGSITDGSGNVLSSSAVAEDTGIAFYNVPPVLTVTNVSAANSSGAQTVTGTATDSGPAVVVGETVLLKNFSTVLGSAVVQADGSWSITAILPTSTGFQTVALVWDNYGGFAQVDAVSGASSAGSSAGSSTNISGNDNTVNMSGAGSTANVSGGWDVVNLSGSNSFATAAGAGDSVFASGSSEWVTLNGATEWAALSGANQAVTGNGGSEWITLSGTTEWATVKGSNSAATANQGSEWVSLDGATEWGTLGGSDELLWASGSGEWVTINGATEWATLSGSSEALWANGSSEWITLNGSTEWATLSGANEAVTLTGSSEWASLYGSSDWATLNGAGEALDIFGGNELIALAGAGDWLDFHWIVGHDTVTGFTSADSVEISSSLFANWTALKSHVSQSGADTLIKLDANNSITLKNVTATTLSASQFHFG